MMLKQLANLSTYVLVILFLLLTRPILADPSDDLNSQSNPFDSTQTETVNPNPLAPPPDVNDPANEVLPNEALNQGFTSTPSPLLSLDDSINQTISKEANYNETQSRQESLSPTYEFQNDQNTSFEGNTNPSSPYIDSSANETIIGNGEHKGPPQAYVSPVSPPSESKNLSPSLAPIKENLTISPSLPPVSETKQNPSISPSPAPSSESKQNPNFPSPLPAPTEEIQQKPTSPAPTPDSPKIADTNPNPNEEQETNPNPNEGEETDPNPDQEQETNQSPPNANVDSDFDAATSADHPGVQPFNYRAEDDMLDFVQDGEDEEGYWGGANHMNSGVRVVLVCLCVIGLAGFVYKVKTNRKRHQYQPLAKRSVSI